MNGQVERHEELDRLRHSASHIMAQALKRLYPEVKLAIGPPIDEGFYYDIDCPTRITEEELPKIEAEMAKIVKADFPFEQTFMNKEDALRFFKEREEKYKLEIIQEIPDAKVSLFTDGDFVDLCEGPHLASTGELKAFKLLSVAGAYWRGSEKNKMLQRIYGTAYTSPEELERHLTLIEEAKKRDHRKLGRELDYFSMLDEIGAGFVLYHPKGGMLRYLIEDYVRKQHLRRGYQFVLGPSILKSDIWIRSGHYSMYKDLMYIFQVEGQEYAVKPMNCPGHILIYKSKLRSYRDLPLRFFELGTVHRNEKSGVLHGLLRVRGFTQDDAHLFVAEEQLKEEIERIIDFTLETMRDFGFQDWSIELSTRPEKSIGSDEAWETATEALRSALKDKGLVFAIHEGEGAFYGPKIDIRLKDALGREWQCATIQVDFALPERFDLTYAAADGKEHRPVMIHRAILGSLERFIGALLEHYTGALPAWLAPVQARILPVKDAQQDYARALGDQLKAAEVRSEVDDAQQTLSNRIRQAQVEKVPYMLIVGEKEKLAGTVSVRSRTGGDLGAMPLDAFLEKLQGDVAAKR